MTLHTSTRRRRHVGAVLLTLLALVGGCAQTTPGGRPLPTSSGGEPGPAGTYGPDDIVLRVDIVDGFIPREYLVTRLPIITVYGDGRAITQGPMIDIYPSPALPNVLVQTISPAGINALVRLALDRGVGNEVAMPEPIVYDAPSTRFTVLTDVGPRVTNANALDHPDEGGGLNAAQRSARQALRDLLDDLTDLSKTLGPDAVDEQKQYQPEVLAAVSREWTAAESPNVPVQPERTWPGPTLPGGPVGTIPGIGCVTVTGDDMATVLDAAKTATVLTPWTSDGGKWLVGFRPLLPEETSCADLA
jgi:hypothetical protein